MGRLQDRRKERDVGTLYESNESAWELIARGKVRDVYAYAPDEMLIVTSDRLSAFDVILPTPIPEKGTVLTQISNFWFAETGGIIANHIVDPEPFAADGEYAHLAGRSIVVRRAQALPVEAIVRGYLTGSGRKDYERTGQVCGIPLPEGLVEASRLPEPLFTPSTKAALGTHDENISFAQTADLIGTELAERVRDAALELYSFGAAHALERGIIIADTKFEFGMLDGELILIDEALTPDSSRFWPADGYEPGRSQPSYDKQYVRDYLETLAWDKRPPGPELPEDVVSRTRAKYREAYARLTGSELR
jgi:phosphoribosylaminoimidazole-succinocarboxamide synthase